MRHTTELAGPYAVIIPAEPADEVRVIDLPDHDTLAVSLQHVIGCTVVASRVADGLRFWFDEQGTHRQDCAVNLQAAWLEWIENPAAGRRPAVAGTVVVTLADPTPHGAIQGLSAAEADRLVRNAREPALRRPVESFTILPRGPRGTPPAVVAPRRPDVTEECVAWVVSGYLADALSGRGGELRVGVLCDTGQSMSGFTEQTASLTGVMLAAAHRAAARYDPYSGVRRSATTAAVQTEPGVLPCLELPGFDPPHPILPIGPARRRGLDDGVESLTDRLRLLTPGGCRLIVLITDAQAPRTILDRTRLQLRRLRRSGCGVLWLWPATTSRPHDRFPGTTLVIDPDDHLERGALGEAMNTEIQRPNQPDPDEPGEPRAGGPPDPTAPDGEG